jgi:RNA polymerase sigma factor (sigma-70 family)
VSRPTQQALEALVDMAMGMAEAWAWKVGQPQRADELTGSACRALADAVRTHTDAGGASLKTHARRRILGELLDATKAERKRLGRETLLDDLAGELPPGVEDDPDALDRAAGVDALVFDPEGALLQEEKKAALRREVAALPKKLRRHVELHWWQDRGWDDVSKALGIPVRTLKDHDKKIRALLKVKLREYDDHPSVA